MLTLRQKQKAIGLFLFLASVLTLGFFAMPALAKTVPKKKPVSVKTASLNGRVPRRVDGVLVAPKNSNNKIVAVMIENHPDARPQAGLNQASVVYEALAEGGIPRFLALFSHTGDVGLIGPVRSLRPYFVRYAAEYESAMAHAGGSPDGLNTLRQLRLRNIEGLKDPTARFFFRRGSGVHALFTNGQLLNQALGQIHDPSPTYHPWTFVAEPVRKFRRKGNHGAVINLSSNLYKAEFQYDWASNNYARLTAGRPQIDRVTRQQVTVKNVVIILTPKEKVLDRHGRLDINVLGHGRAVILQNGSARTIKWSKPRAESRTIFAELGGGEVAFNRGPVWITVLPAGHSYRVY